MAQPDIYLARHGETEWSLSGRHTGVTDIPLTDNGRSHAEALASRLAGRDFAAVFTSPMQRAKETCRLAGLGDRAAVRDALMEWNYGHYEGETTPDIRRSVPGWSVWTHGCPGGESPEEVGARCDELIQELIEAEGDVVCFAHGHILRVLGARWMGIAPGKGANLLLSTGTLSVLGWERTNRAIRLWNDGSHLG